MSYLEALSAGELERAFSVFSVPARLTPSRWVILNEYQVKNPTALGICERNLQQLGEALKSFNTAYVRYPKTLQELVPRHIPSVPRCPSAGNHSYLYARRDDHFFTVSCPDGHGRTPGFPLYSPIDGVIHNPKAQLISFYHVSRERESEGATEIVATGVSSAGAFETRFAFSPLGDLETGTMTSRVRELLQTMAHSKPPRITDLDAPSFLLGMAMMSDDALIKAAHCRLAQDKLYYRMEGARRRLGEIPYSDVVKHIGEIPTCPASGKPYQVGPAEGGQTRVYCPGSAHLGAGLGENQPSRTFK